jgi:uncharacterized protein (TIGR02246 family)
MTMNRRLQLILLYGFLVSGIVVLAIATPVHTPSTEGEERQALDKFNQEFISACQTMDHPAAAALWADDGADLLPGMAPMVGKTKISEWLKGLTPQLAGAKMIYCTVDWQDIQIHGDLAYEWGINRQKIDFPPPKKSFENEGKILLILKRQGDGSWKIALESWNTNPQTQETH